MYEQNTQAATNIRLNQQSLDAQRKLLLDHLQAGNSINFMQAMDLGITHLRTRIAELRSRDINVYSRPMAYRNIKGEDYSLFPLQEQQPGLAGINDIKPAASRRLVK